MNLSAVSRIIIIKGKKLFIALATIGTFFFLTEFIVRILAPQELISDLIAFDGDICHRLKRNANGVQMSREYSVEIRTNAHGLRDRFYSYDKKENTFRILVLGDSHTFGWGVKQDNTFTKVLEQKLNSNVVELTYEVINCGILGYATGHLYLFFREEGFKFAPELVVIAMDLPFSIATNKDFFSFENGQVFRNSRKCIFRSSRLVSKYIPFSSYLRGHSHLFRFAGVHLLSLYNKIKGDGEYFNNAVNPIAEHELANTKKILGAFKRELAFSDIAIALVILPEFSRSDRQIRRSFLDFLLKEEIPCLLLQGNFDAHANNANLTFTNSHRFNADGHRFIAAKIEGFLKKKELLQKDF